MSKKRDTTRVNKHNRRNIKRKLKNEDYDVSIKNKKIKSGYHL
jgi:hypothetical protein